MMSRYPLARSTAPLNLNFVQVCCYELLRKVMIPAPGCWFPLPYIRLASGALQLGIWVLRDLMIRKSCHRSDTLGCSRSEGLQAGDRSIEQDLYEYVYISKPTR